MHTIFLDSETYYDNEYSLKKMTPVEYILDPRFEMIGTAVKEGVTGQGYWVEGKDLPAFFKSLDPAKTVTVTFNSLFDNAIYAWRYGFVPRLMVDMLGVSRACLGHKLRSLSLAQVGLHLGIGVKGDTVHQVKGMTAAAIKQAGLYESYISYSLQDNEICAAAYDKLVRGGVFPARELAVMDMVLRCAIEPRFQLDLTVLAEHLHAIRTQKDHLLARAMMVGADGKTALMSNDRFAELLRSLGVEPPTKTSPVTGKVTYAFAKSDPAFLDLQEHEDPAVQAVVAARLGHKTTLEETRCERFLKLGQLQWPDGRAPCMPIPLRYSGAHTHRLSGDWKLNLQNLPRGGNLRRALIAPAGHKVVAVDASQIEARIVAWLSGQDDLVEAFEQGRDIYSEFATEVFGHPVDRKLKDDPDMVGKGFVGKTSILGLGYGMGWPKFQRTVKIQSINQLGREIALSDDEALHVVNTYRTKYHRIPETWRALDNAIQVLALGGSFQIGPCVFEQGAILLPSGLRLHYHELERTADGWRFTYGGKPKYLYGGKLLENISQALARIIVMDAACRIQVRLAKFSVKLNLQAHDELVFIVPDEHVEEVRRVVLEEMVRRPRWGNRLPLAAECGVGQSYGDAK